MATKIPEEVIDQIRSSFNIVDFIGQYVHLRKSGRSYMGLCPFHSEKSPSFSVLEDKQIFHCFGCGEGGNLISFVMKIEGLTFPEAMQFLAEKSGIILPNQEEAHPSTIEESSEKQTIFKAYSLAVKLFQHILFQTDYGVPAMEYMKRRGISLETAEVFELGFAPESWDFVTQFYEKRGFSLALVHKAGILAQRDFDRKYFDLFRNRLIFPIADSQGRTVAFGGRILNDTQPKYLNSPEHPFFNKSRILFNLHRAKSDIRRKRQVVLFEGYMDVIAAWEAGVRNGVASLGTSFTEEQAKIIKRNADQVVICYDSDAPGIEAAMKAAHILETAECQVRIVRLEDGLDPDEYIKKYGKEKFTAALNQSLTITAFKMEYLRRRHDVSDEQQRLVFIHEMLKQISSLRSAVERDHYLRLLAEEFHYSLEALKEELRKLFYQQKKAEKGDKLPRKWNNSIDNGRHVPHKTLLPAHYNAEKKLIVLMMHNADWAEEIKDKIGGNFNVDEFAALAAYLYHYYAIGNVADPSKFISELDDEKLIQKASELAMEEVPDDLTSRALADYIQQVLNYPILVEIEKLKSEQKKLEKQGDSLEAAKIGIEILQLRKLMKKS